MTQEEHPRLGLVLCCFSKIGEGTSGLSDLADYASDMAVGAATSNQSGKDDENQFAVQEVQRVSSGISALP